MEEATPEAPDGLMGDDATARERVLKFEVQMYRLRDGEYVVDFQVRCSATLNCRENQVTCAVPPCKDQLFNRHCSAWFECIMVEWLHWMIQPPCWHMYFIADAEAPGRAVPLHGPV